MWPHWSSYWVAQENGMVFRGVRFFEEEDGVWEKFVDEFYCGELGEFYNCVAHEIYNNVRIWYSL